MEKKELKLRKITEKPEIMDVEGQGDGCWNDCYIGGVWINQSSVGQMGCNYEGPHYTAYNSLFS
ncbi:hypothetical protein J7E73_20595 [Paenibacillus albidus]|uniref:hypothetical protein n=1 Tax=Paenibacillus albidus TaxID=2041023 RepID=UPI001BEC6FDB|nr:hypothetical protein [Paenibacillus albidus]MBT2291477.1 hypothetical protein [Paenibacillus albidus]